MSTLPVWLAMRSEDDQRWYAAFIKRAIRDNRGPLLPPLESADGLFADDAIRELAKHSLHDLRARGLLKDRK